METDIALEKIILEMVSRVTKTRTATLMTYHVSISLRTWVKCVSKKISQTIINFVKNRFVHTLALSEPLIYFILTSPTQCN